MRNTINPNIADNIVANFRGGACLRVGAFSITELTKSMKGWKVIKEYEISGRIGCKYSAIAGVQPTAPSQPTKAPNYAYECNKRVKRFFTTGNRQLVFYPFPKTAHPKANYILVDPNGNETAINSQTASAYGVSIGTKPITMLINMNQIFRLNKTRA